MSHHATAIIRGDVEIGERVVIEPFAVITGPCRIGDDSYIGAHATIGAPPQHSGTYPSPTIAPVRAAGVELGRGVCVRELSTIHQGLLKPTRVGGGTLLMAGCHIAHDAEVGRNVTAGSYLLLGGFTFIADGATFGQGCVTHPWVVIGEGAMVGLNTSVIRDVDPYLTVVGAPARTIGVNEKRLDGRDVPIGSLDDFANLVAVRDALKATWYAEPPRATTA